MTLLVEKEENNGKAEDQTVKAEKGRLQLPGRHVGRCLVCHLDRGWMIRILGGRMWKYRRVFRGRGLRGRT